MIDRLDVGGHTDIGLKRPRNEDFFNLMMPPENSPLAAFGALFLVADGMGGMTGGEVASKTAVEAIMSRYYVADNPQTDLSARLHMSLEAANSAVQEQAIHLGVPRIGTTAAGLVLRAGYDALIFNVGDCRVYRVRGTHSELLSRDQSVIAQQIESGQSSEDEAFVAHNTYVTAFLGQSAPLTPIYRHVRVQSGDTYILCSDGVWSLVDAGDMTEAVRDTPGQYAAEKLVQRALDAGGTDNATALVVRVIAEGERQRPWWLRMMPLRRWK